MDVWRIMPLMASERARSMLLPARTVCSALMALLMLALVAFVQAELSASTSAISSGAGISATRQGDTVALLRITGKAPAAEVRAGRPLPVKLVSGNPGALAPAAELFTIGQVLPAEPVVTPALAVAPPAHANQPRAPPTA